MTKNHLANQASLYLQQHVENPVDWYPWGPEALEKAKRENKPILLSIGYSACHWCHVMARESFSDEGTAKLMNELFVNIKVDREERPDLDKIYQTAHQLLTGRSGGWPLTVFLTPEDQMPIFVGTYFPLVPRYGMPTFKEVLRKIAEIFQTDRNTIEKQNKQLAKALAQLNLATIDKNLTEQPLIKGYEELLNQFDRLHGGFGGAPKFPHPTNLDFLIHYWKKHKHTEALNVVNTTLTRMACGGIYDQIGGGFFRYATDEKWRIPHFEKMLYDNAQLLGSYAQIYAVTNVSLYGDIVEQTILWASREMQTPAGGFYATLDADSEHVEGKYYYWDRAEVKKILTADEFVIAGRYLGLNKPANFEGHWHFYANHVCVDVPVEMLQIIRQKLLRAREQRVKPGRDGKIIGSWNGLMINGLAMAGKYLQRKDFIDLAQQTFDFMMGHVQVMVYLDDFAFLLNGVVTLLQVSERKENLEFAIKLANNLLELFEDKENGGFFFTSVNHEKLIQRPKPLIDEAVPSGNGVAALALLRLGRMLGEQQYLTASKKTLEMANATINAYPSLCSSLLIALDEYLNF